MLSSTVFRGNCWESEYVNIGRCPFKVFSNSDGNSAVNNVNVSYGSNNNRNNYNKMNV